MSGSVKYQRVWQTLLLIVGLLSVRCAVAGFSDDDVDLRDAQQILDIIYKPRRLQSMNAAISWRNCGSSYDPAQLVSLLISPDPLHLPGNISIAFNIKLNSDLPAAISLNVVVKKKIGPIWIEAPCVHQKGSCHYPDICQSLAQMSCPAAFRQHNIPCQCPIKQGVYDLPVSAFNVEAHVPSGKYKMTAKFEQAGKAVGCIFMQLSVA